GEIAAHCEYLSETCSGVPPATGTRQNVDFPCLQDLNKIHCPSGEHSGCESSSVPCVSWFCSPVVRSNLHRLKLPERFELKMTKRPSGETHPRPSVNESPVTCLFAVPSVLMLHTSDCSP